MANTAENPGKREEDANGVPPMPPVAGPAAKGAKIKLGVLYRVPLALDTDIVAIAGREAVTVEYVLRAMGCEARERLRELAGEDDVALLAADARAFAKRTEGTRVVGDPMTVYVRPTALEAMHRALGDPWCVLPRATVVGAYFTTVVARLVMARRAG